MVKVLTPEPTPPLMVSPAIVTAAPAGTVKMRNSGVPAAPLRTTVSAAGPGPSMSIAVDRSGRALDRVIAPRTDGANVIVSAAGLRSACSIAARNVPGPASARLVTGIVAGTTRPSSNSGPNGQA